MSAKTIHIFSASRARFILTILGTIGVSAIVFIFMGLHSAGVLTVILTLLLVSFVQGEMVTRIVITSESVKLERQRFFINKPSIIIEKLNILAKYRSKAGPKGIPTRVLEIRRVDSEEVVVEIQADVTGWSEEDLIEISKILS